MFKYAFVSLCLVNLSEYMYIYGMRMKTKKTIKIFEAKFIYVNI